MKQSKGLRLRIVATYGTCDVVIDGEDLFEKAKAIFGSFTNSFVNST